jgi:hypothetical protein
MQVMQRVRRPLSIYWIYKSINLNGFYNILKHGRFQPYILIFW